MYAKPEKVRARRAKRRLKAVASIAVALCAGVFLACVKKPEVDAGTSDASDTRDVGVAEAETDATGDVAEDVSRAIVTSLDGSADAKADALAKRQPGPRDAAVDVREHRKGMPVRDNLLE